MHTKSCSALLKTLAIISLANLSFLAPGAAHDVWSDGTRVPAWVKRYCCGQEEVHRLSMRQIHHVEGAGVWTGTIALSQITASWFHKMSMFGFSTAPSRTSPSRRSFASLFHRAASSLARDDRTREYSRATQRENQEAKEARCWPARDAVADCRRGNS
jgi:hypothetical protein